MPTATASKESAFLVFFVFWALLGLSSFLFFHFNRDAKLKKRVFPFFVVGVGVIFGTFAAYTTGWHPAVLMVMLPLVGLITFLNLRTTKFCDSCGRTLYRQSLFGPSKFCPHCGSELGPRR